MKNACMGSNLVIGYRWKIRYNYNNIAIQKIIRKERKLKKQLSYCLCLDTHFIIGCYDGIMSRLSNDRWKHC